MKIFYSPAMPIVAAGAKIENLGQKIKIFTYFFTFLQNFSGEFSPFPLATSLIFPIGTAAIQNTIKWIQFYKLISYLLN